MGGGGGGTTICLRVDQVVDCFLWNVGPLLFNGCAKLLDIGRNWNTLYTPIQSIPNMLNGWHVRWVCWPCKNWDVFSFQELRTDPCSMGPCSIMLQHEVMVVDEWHNNGPQDLVTYLCARGGKSTKIFYSSKSTITLLKFYLSTSKSTSLKIYSSKSKK